MGTMEDGVECFEDKNGVYFENQQLFYTAQNCHQIPPMLGMVFGSRTKRLDLSYCALTTLSGLEKFGKLEELVLDNNHLGDTFAFPYLPNLHTLSLNKNKISDVDVLIDNISPCFPHLRFLSLHGNPACPDELSGREDEDETDYERYRCHVLHRLPKLEFLDSRAVSSKERLEARRVGAFARVVKPDPAAIVENGSGMTSDTLIQSPYSPLPNSGFTVGQHQGAFGKCRYRYSGKHSEGNRFIRNSDL